MNDSRCLGFFLACLISATAVGGSKVGGGTMSSDVDLYSTALPPLFNGDWSQVTENWIRLKGPTELSGIRIKRNIIEVPSLRERYPAEVLALDRQAFIAFFKTRGFTEINASGACLVSMKLVKPSGFFVVNSWGLGRGVIFTGPNTTAVAKGVDALVRTLKISEGACGWK